MDLKVMLSTFAVIFVAELGDKTQFAAMAASSSSKSTMSVLIGVVLALSTAGALGVLAGRLLGEALDPNVMRWVAGFAFIGMGTWYIFKG